MNAPHPLVIDDHAIVRLGVRQLLGASAVQQGAADIATAPALLAQQPIERVLLDLDLGDRFGLGAPSRLRDARPELSPRETEVLRLAAAGKATRAIADALNRSVKTIETHKQTLKTQLGTGHPAMRVRRAVEWFGERG